MPREFVEGRSSVASLPGGAPHRNRALLALAHCFVDSDAVEFCEDPRDAQERIKNPTVENGIQVPTVERPSIQPHLNWFREKIRKMLSRRRHLSTDGGVHPVIVVKHRWRTQELQRPNECVSQDMGHRDRGPTESNLD